MKQSELSDESIREHLKPFRFSPGAELCQMIRAYIETLLAWNAKIALTTVIDPAEIVRVHFGESFFAVGVSGIERGRIADIGTGPGFPGIPMRMAVPESFVILVEAIAKKAAFLQEVKRRLGLSDLDIIRCRMEDYSPAEPLDFVTSRALGGYVHLLAWAEQHMAPSGKVILLLGENEAASLSRLRSFLWRRPAKIPTTVGKFVLVGQKSP